MRNLPDRVMIFAAGFGTRMRPLTDKLPKPLIPVSGRALIDHTLDLVPKWADGGIVINLHYRADLMAQHLDGRGVTIVTETPDILDTGGGLKNALSHLGSGPIFTSNSDALWKGPNPFELLRTVWNPDRMDALLLCTPITRCVGRTTPGDFHIDETGRLNRGGDLVYGGIQIMKTDRVAAMRKDVFSLNLIWNEIATDGRLFGAVYPGFWADVGTPEGIGEAEKMMRAGKDVD